MKKTALTFAALAICLTALAGIPADSQANDLKEFKTKDLEKHFRKTDKELQTMKKMEKKLESAGRQSSNTARKSAVNNIQDHMGSCILRREDDLGQDHTIKKHGEHVTAGTTSAAEVGAPVGTSSAKTSLQYKEGLAGWRLRQLSKMQSIFVAAQTNMQPAIEKQGDSMERYTNKCRQFREELEKSHQVLTAELENRAKEKEMKKEQEGH
jgi:hypothetical protein